MDGTRPSYLLIEDVDDDPRPYVPLERMQSRELRNKIGFDLYINLEWRLLHSPARITIK